LTIKTGTNGELFSVFCDLYKTLIDRKEFDVDLTPEFYRQVQENLAERERFLISIVYDNDQPIAGHVSSLLGDTSVYLLGATNMAGSQTSCVSVQWAVIQMAKERGCCFYDLGGIDPDRNPGVYSFQKRLGGFDITARDRLSAIRTVLNGFW
jgi:lipid II:glycine glycyltransferase (peptidoglycan interpeptide bridge formation enzyme)